CRHLPASIRWEGSTWSRRAYCSSPRTVTSPCPSPTRATGTRRSTACGPHPSTSRTRSWRSWRPASISKTGRRRRPRGACREARCWSSGRAASGRCGGCSPPWGSRSIASSGPGSVRWSWATCRPAGTGGSARKTSSASERRNPWYDRRVRPRPDASTTPERQMTDGSHFRPGPGQVQISRADIHERIQELGAEIRRDHQGQALHLICVLNGAFIFMADLVRAIDMPLSVDFLSVSSYGSGTKTSGRVKLIKDLDLPIAGKHVILVEDIVDTGITMDYLLRYLQNHQPA